MVTRTVPDVDGELEDIRECDVTPIYRRNRPWIYRWSGVESSRGMGRFTDIGWRIGLAGLDQLGGNGPNNDQ